MKAAFLADPDVMASVWDCFHQASDHNEQDFDIFEESYILSELFTKNHLLEVLSLLIEFSEILRLESEAILKT